MKAIFYFVAGFIFLSSNVFAQQIPDLDNADFREDPSLLAALQSATVTTPAANAQALVDAEYRLQNVKRSGDTGPLATAADTPNSEFLAASIIGDKPRMLFKREFIPGGLDQSFIGIHQVSHLIHNPAPRCQARWIIIKGIIHVDASGKNESYELQSVQEFVDVPQRCV